MSRRIVSLLAAVVAGLLIGLAGGFIQAHRMIWIFDGRYLVVPWGAALVVVVLLLSIRAAAKVLERRSAGWLLFLGWLVMTFFLATETRSGDLAVSSGLRQWGYLLSGVVLGSAVATLPPRSFASLRVSEHDSEGVAGRAGDPSSLD